VIRTLKIRLYPTKEQGVLLEKHFGSCRFVWNYFLKARNEYYAGHKNDKKKGLTVFDSLKMLTSLKGEKKWLYEINSQSLQHSLMKLDDAFNSFFKHNTDYPKFKSKKDN
jgi:putative transposase